MALVIHLKRNGQIIVNGAVLENMSGRSISLCVRNEAAILRDRDILKAEEATTPATRIYFALQCMYLFPARRDEYAVLFEDLFESFREAVPSAGPIAAEVRAAMAADNLYAALKCAQSLIRHEGKILSHVHERFVTGVQRDPAAGEPSAD
jgi:flagellar protein FlbT